MGVLPRAPNLRGRHGPGVLVRQHAFNDRNSGRYARMKRGTDETRDLQALQSKRKLASAFSAPGCGVSARLARGSILAIRTNGRHSPAIIASFPISLSLTTA